MSVGGWIGGVQAVPSVQVDPILATLPTGLQAVWYGDQYAATPRPYIPNTISTASAPKNLLTAPRRLFNNANLWTKAGTITVVDNAAVGPDGLTEASTVNLANSATLQPIAATIPLPAGTYTLAGSFKRNTGTDQPISMGFTGRGSQTFTATASWQRFSFSLTLVSQTTVTPLPIWALTGASNVQVCDVGLYAGASDPGADPIAGHIVLGDTAYTHIGSYAGGALDVSGGGYGIVQFPNSPLSSNRMTAIALLSKVGAGTAYQAFLSQINSFDAFSAFMENSGLTRGPYLGIASNAFNPSLPGVPQTMLSDGYHTFAWRYDGTTSDVFFDDLLMWSSAASGLSAVQFQDLFFNAVAAASLYSGYAFAGGAFWSAALTDAGVRTAHGLLKTRALQRSSISVTVPQRVYCAEGDSITGSFTYSYPYKFVTHASPKAYVTDHAISGSGLSTVLARATKVDALLPTSRGARKFILSVLIGANDLGSYGGGAAQYLTDLAAYCDARRAAGWIVIVCTVLPHTIAINNTTTPDTTFNGRRATFNAAIPGWVGVHCDAIADFAADATMGPDSACTNTTYYADGWHPTDAGQVILEGIIRTVINGL